MQQLNIIHNQDCLEGLKQYRDGIFHCCVTSPPYWGLRDYGVDGQLGLESSPEQFIEKMVEVFREVKRVLRDDGTCWINIGDSYAGNGGAYGSQSEYITGRQPEQKMGMAERFKKHAAGIKPKDMVGIPWMLAFALRADGWYLRQDIIWSKPNPMPESIKDRCTKSHEYIFLLSKSPKYYYNQDTIKEPASENTHPRRKQIPSGWDTGPTNHKGKSGRYSDTGVGWGKTSEHAPGDDRIRPSRIKNNKSFDAAMSVMPEKRNKRSVWTITPQAFKEAHFATFPEELPYTCIKAGCPEGGIVLDPFMGAGTTALVARKLQRQYVGYEINSEYVRLAETRLQKELGMFI